MNRLRPQLIETGLLLGILVVYLFIGALFALYTPPWQVPDEPAHYNYIRILAEERRLPVLEMGDFPAGYLETLKAQRFPPEMPIDPIRYESHQPPLYYLLAAPLFVLTGGALVPLRLFSLVLGAGVILLAYTAVRGLFPRQPLLALGTAAFVAFLPQHVAMMAGVNNDSLAELILAAVIWQLILLAQAESAKTVGAARAAFLGGLIGLGLVTKTTDYLALPLAALALGLRWRRGCAGCGRLALLIFGPALLIGLPWWVRNAVTYGGLDLLGLGRHNWVVVGQPRTSEWLAAYGAAEVARRFVQTTFQSFWGQFGWMGVVLDQRIYAGLALVSGLAGLGWVLQVVAGLRPAPTRPALTPGQRDGLILLAGLVLLTLASYLWYNLTFVQHQGRYLFPALIPIGLGVTVGLRRVFQPDGARLAAALLLALLAGLVAFGLFTADLAGGPIVFVGLLAAGLGVAGWRGHSLTGPALAAFYAALAAFDGVALFGFILPMLRP